MKKASVLLAILAMAGCASGPETASGRPEILASATPSQAKAKLAQSYMTAGWMVDQSDDLGLSLSRPFDTTMEVMVGRGQYRLRFNFVPTSAGTWITAAIHTQGAVATDMSDGKGGAQVQQTLQALFGPQPAAPTR